MRRFPCVLLATVVAIGFASFASAADMPVKARVAPAPAAFSWTGLYIGGYLGGAWAKHTTSSLVPGVGFFDNNASDSSSINGRGLLAGGTIGYNYQISNVVLGVEFEGGYLGVNKTVVIPDTGDAGDQLNVKYNGYAVFAGRAGVTFDRWLAYVKGGAAWARVSHAEGDLDLPGPAFDPLFSYSISQTVSGWALGGGLEWAMTNNWSFKGEYLFLRFGDFTAYDAGGRGYRIHNEAHTAKFGINYRFGAM